jgi:hypothetical protein
MSEPATKADLLELKDELRAEFKSDLAEVKDELIEAFRDGQTEMLRAFYGFMQTVQDRFKEDDDRDAALRRRMTTLESRLLAIEKRLDLPPGNAQ